MKNNNRIFFLTGATGLIGSYLLRILLQNGHTVYILARKKNDKNAEDRIKDILLFWDEKTYKKYKSNIKIFKGDVTRADVGLSKNESIFLSKNVEQIFHCAAVTKFNLSLDETRRVNVEGTRNILDLAMKWNEIGKLRKVNYISTAYICGNYRGIFKEDNLDLGQQFKSSYEQSKFEAEKIIQEYRNKGIWVDIFRPPLVVGESLTGKTNTFQHIYQILRIWNLGIFDTFPGLGVYLNIVTVDSLSRIIFEVSKRSTFRNTTYHTFNMQGIFFERMLEIASNIIGFKRPNLVYFDQFDINVLTNVQKMILKNSILYFNPFVSLKSSNTNRIFKTLDLTFPEFTEEIFITLLSYLLKIGFLKKNKDEATVY